MPAIWLFSKALFSALGGSSLMHIEGMVKKTNDRWGGREVREMNVKVLEKEN